MSGIVFGRDLPPEGKPVRMAYVARRPACGHIVVAQADTRQDALQRFLEAGVAGLTVERIPSDQVRDEGFCGCPQPTAIQSELPL